MVDKEVTLFTFFFHENPTSFSFSMFIFDFFYLKNYVDFFSLNLEGVSGDNCLWVLILAELVGIPN